MLAAHLNHLDIISLLVAAHASLSRTDAAGRTARDIAASLGHEMAVSLLAAAAESESRESELATQEAMVQELRRRGGSYPGSW